MMAKRKARPTLMMLERWIEPAVRRMEPQFTSHEYIQKLRELYPADYAHDLTLCTLEQGFPKSLAVLHRAIVNELRRVAAAKVIGRKKSQDIRGNSHLTAVWRRAPRLGPTPAARLMTGAALQAARERLGLSKSDLARRAGVSLAAVSRWERDERNMQWAAYEALEEALAASQAERERATGLGEAWPPPPSTDRKPRKPPPPPPMTGAQLREARLALGWTKTELARRAGIADASVSLWERGKKLMTPRGYEAIQSALKAARSPRRRAGREVESSPVDKKRPERM